MRVQRTGSMEPFAAFLSAGVPAAASLVQRNSEAGGAAGVPPQTIKYLIGGGVTPANRILLRVSMIRVFGSKFSDVRPVEALSGRRRTEKAAGSTTPRGDRGPACEAGSQRLGLVYGAQWQRRWLVM